MGKQFDKQPLSKALRRAALRKGMAPEMVKKMQFAAYQLDLTAESLGLDWGSALTADQHFHENRLAQTVAYTRAKRVYEEATGEEFVVGKSWPFLPR